jgi:hypothetical protein
MNNSARFFGLMVTLCCITLIPLVSAQSDVQTLTVGDFVEDVDRQAEFLLDAEAGQSVTLRWEGRQRRSDRCDAPLEEIIDVETDVMNAEGDVLVQTSLLYTLTATIQVYTLKGTAPYAISAAICGGSNMTLSVIDGDAIARVEQPALSMGETVSVASASVDQEQLLVFPLNVQDGDVFTVDTHFINSSRSDDYPMYAAVVRDANGQVVPSDFSERLPIAYSVTAPVYTVAGQLPYRLELAALPLYNAGYVDRFGEILSDVTYSVQVESGNTAIVDGGVLAPGTPVEGILDTRPVIYTFDVAEGETVTFSFEFPQTPYQYFLNADGELADVVSTWVNQGTRVMWVMSLAGPPPYTYYLQGEGSYSLLLEAGNTIEGNELGTLAPGEALRVTMPPTNDRLDYITLDVNPEATVTLNWGVPQTGFFIQDSTNSPVYPRNDDWNDGYAIVDLSQGTPPFTVLMENPVFAGQTFTFTLAEGETPLLPDEAAAANTSENSEGSAQSETQAETGCTVSASSNINQRSGPGTDFDVSGTLAGGSSASVDGQATGADGFIWYRLTIGAWVRSDLVAAMGACSEVPEVTP